MPPPPPPAADSDTITKPRQRTQRQLAPLPPPLYWVVFHNDDRTTMDFVVSMLMSVFQKSFRESASLMMKVHLEGSARVQQYPKPIAEAKVEQVRRAAAAAGYPLRLTIEPDAAPTPPPREDQPL